MQNLRSTCSTQAEPGHPNKTNISIQNVQYVQYTGRAGPPLPLSKRFTGVLSGGEIHCLRRLRKEGSPDFLSRSWQLVRRSVARFVCGRGGPALPSVATAYPQPLHAEGAARLCRPSPQHSFRSLYVERARSTVRHHSIKNPLAA